MELELNLTGIHKSEKLEFDSLISCLSKRSFNGYNRSIIVFGRNTFCGLNMKIILTKIHLKHSLKAHINRIVKLGSNLNFIENIVTVNTGRVERTEKKKRRIDRSD